MRKSQKLKRYDDGPIYLTKEGILKLKRKIACLEREMPEAVSEVTRTAEMGDLSENAAYTAAKYKMRRMQNSLLASKERLKQVVEIGGENTTGRVELGSTVEVEVNGKIKSFYIVGPREADPFKGKVSHKSPLGNALLGCEVGEHTKVKTAAGIVRYTIKNII